MSGLAALGQTIQVVDRSGKVVSTSRHLFDVFKIGKDAYSRQKRDTQAKREFEASQTRSLKRPGRAYTIDDATSARSGRSHRSHRSHRYHQPNHEPTRSPTTAPLSPPEPAGVPYSGAHPEQAPAFPRRHSEFTPHPVTSAPTHLNLAPTHYQSAAPPQPQWSPTSQHKYGQSVHASRPGVPPPPPPSSPAAAATAVARGFEPPHVLARRNTMNPKQPSYQSGGKSDGVDLDLAYGDLPPDLLYPGSPSIAPTAEQNQAQLTGLIGKANGLLDEANCLRSGATATIAHLQKNPDAMAAVGLTLAEISNLVKKMSPMVLSNLKNASPAVFSLLAHPQFLVAVGVATGVTIIAFGGYKIVKRIQERKQMESMGDEALLPVEDVSRIETWRRGIADAEAQSVGTSVEGEFITPLAHSLSRMNLAEEKRERRLATDKRDKERGRERKPKSKTPRSVASGQSGRSSQSHRSKRSSSEPRATKSKPSSGSSSRGAGTRSKKTASKKYDLKPSPLRRLLLA